YLPGDAGCHGGLRRSVRVRIRKVRPCPEARPDRFRHQGEVRVPEDGDSVPPDAQLGLLRPVSRLSGVLGVCEGHRYGSELANLETGRKSILIIKPLNRKGR